MYVPRYVIEFLLHLHIASNMSESESDYLELSRVNFGVEQSRVEAVRGLWALGTSFERSMLNAHGDS